jgi:hypothetical protein
MSLVLRRAAFFLIPLLCALAGSAGAASFTPVPAMEGQPKGHLGLRVVSYNGGTNGAITVEVMNQGQTQETFVAQGLFFVPNGDPNSAPQRLGAVGPFQQRGSDTRKDSLSLAPGESVTVTLDVYCIDSHRSSPSSSTQFHLGATRMPRDLSNQINSAANDAAAPYGGVSKPAAKSAVQSEVWKNRDKKWIKLDGEGAQEATK